MFVKTDKKYYICSKKCIYVYGTICCFISGKCLCWQKTVIVPLVSSRG